MYLINLAGLARDLRDRQVLRSDFYGYLLGFLGLNLILPALYAFVIFQRLMPVAAARVSAERLAELAALTPLVLLVLHSFIFIALILALIFYFANRPKTVRDFFSKFIPLCLLQQLNLLASLSITYGMLKLTYSQQFQLMRRLIPDMGAFQDYFPKLVVIVYGLIGLIVVGVLTRNFVISARLSSR